jgi:hypothetical protein
MNSLFGNNSRFDNSRYVVRIKPGDTFAAKITWPTKLIFANGRWNCGHCAQWSWKRRRVLHKRDCKWHPDTPYEVAAKMEDMKDFRLKVYTAEIKRPEGVDDETWAKILSDLNISEEEKNHG